MQPPFPNASVAELVDALDSKSSSFGSAGSIPARGTKSPAQKMRGFFYYINFKPVEFLNMSQNNHLTWQEFQKVEMYVGTIETAEVFKEARNPAYKVVVDFGPLGKRKSSAQITQLYNCEDLIGKQVIAVLNFPPKQIANMISECLVLGAVRDDNRVTLLQPERKVPNGTRIG